MTSDHEFELIMRQALETPHGLVLEFSSKNILSNKFYSLREAARRRGIYAYEPLSLLFPANGKAYMLKRRTDAERRTEAEDGNVASIRGRSGRA